MLGSLVLAAALGVNPLHAHCLNAFDNLMMRSGVLADASDFLEAAAVREAAGNIFEDCLLQDEAPQYGNFPFDGANAYIVAAGLWHAAGDDGGAKRDLHLAEAARSTSVAKYPKLSSDQRLWLYHLDKMIKDDESGLWGVWSSEELGR